MLKPFFVIGTLLSLSLVNSSQAAAQTEFAFEATYYNTFTSTLVQSNFPFNVSVIVLRGESSNAPFGLKSLEGITYSQINLLTGEFSFNTDPTIYGLLNSVPGRIVFEGNGQDTIFGTNSATGFLDFTTLTARASGTFSINGGTGQFQGANGVLSFSEVNQLSLNPAVPSTGKAQISGTFQVQKIPEKNSISFWTLYGLIFILNEHCIFKNSLFFLANTLGKLR